MEEKKRYSLTAAVIILVVTVILSRIVSGLYSVTYSDISFADWVPLTLGYISEILVSLRVALSYCAVGYMTYAMRGRAAVIAVTAIVFLDLLLRFLIDCWSGAILGQELFAAIWLLLQFVYEFVFIILAFIVARMMRDKCYQAEETRLRAKYSPKKAVRYAVLLYLASRVFSEILYLIDFLTTYDDITSGEVASIVKSFLMIFVIYGLVGILFADLFGRIVGQKRKELPSA